MIRYRADWVLPIARPPIRGGWVGIEAGTIVAIGDQAPSDALDLGSVAMLPALVNAHTHLELSHLRGRVPPAERFLDWVRELLRLRRQPSDSAGAVAPSEAAAAARAAIDEARAAGTTLLGDVSNTLSTVPLLCEAEMPARVFYELLGFNTADPEGVVARAETAADGASSSAQVRVSLAAHAPYSVSPGLFVAMRTHLDRRSGQVTSVHLAESPEEVEFVQRGTGGWKKLLQELGVWTETWHPPGCSPAAYLERLGFLRGQLLVVHAVQCSGEDVRRVRAHGATIVACPRSNRYVGVGAPPLDLFYEVGVNVAFGTDSLASVEDLNLFAELAAAREVAPRVPASRLLESATLTGAVALGFGAEYGSLEVGKRAAIISVRVPDTLTDVEEYLVSGIAPRKIRWVADEAGQPAGEREIVGG